ncbi:MAG: hypothetical protein ACREED_04760 [Stellaceae bacterium]
MRRPRYYAVELSERLFSDCGSTNKHTMMKTAMIAEASGRLSANPT